MAEWWLCLGWTLMALLARPCMLGSCQRMPASADPGDARCPPEASG